ncbi:GMC oxidoreductase [Pseudomonas saliphila]|uniref:GMC oxidoreductase n=1 Tax=Pseudomonas saliphila TaxID=2586906 RepID=UPI00123B35F5|nr:GMC family oxidoreductase [Pseudomonas saliphila]
MEINRVSPEHVANEHYELIIIGSGFGSTFFLNEAVKHITGRALVIEWGDHFPWATQVREQRNSDIPQESTYENRGDKPWNMTIALGGGMNCWFTQAPRLHPKDFYMQTHYGVSHDWPVDYDDLEPYYCQVESKMLIAGDPAMAQILPRSMPFPQPPHRGTTVDEMMKVAMPEHHFIVPAGRASVVNDQRGVCCSNATCYHCPANAKFTAENGFPTLFAHPKVDVCVRSEVKSLDYQGDTITAVVFESKSKQYKVYGDMFVLGANAIQAPAILLRSDIVYGETALNLHEQIGADVEVYLDGLAALNGSTISTGLNYYFYDGDFRKERGATVVGFENRWPHGLRPEPGKWHHILPLNIVTEDLPNLDNKVTVDPDSGKAIIHHTGPSEYGRKGLDHVLNNLDELLAAIPVESIHFRRWRITESHVQGTLRMGVDGDGSVVDHSLLHHRKRNLMVVGSSTFPTCSASNPSVTVAAMSIRAADLLYGKGALI